MADIELSLEQARVLGALVEKSITTPKYYPLTVNALVAAVNQKSCRNPVMNLNAGEVGAALLDLEALSLATRDDAGSRVPRWSHRFRHALRLEPESLAVLTVLILRGPQTVAEIRANAAVMGGPGDPQGVVAALEDLGDRAQPLVLSLARVPGQKGERYAHTLCGVPDPASYAPEPAARAPRSDRLAELEARIEALERRLDEAGL